MTALTPGTDPTTPDTRRRATLRGKLWDGFLTFWTMHVRMWVVAIGAVIIAALIWAVSANVKAVDTRQREADARDALIATYSASLRTYDLEVQARNDCVVSVGRSDLNRGQHEATVDAFENLKVLFPDSQGLAKLADAIVAGLRAGPLLSQPPRSVADCPDEPTPPTPPFPLAESEVKTLR